MKMKQMTFVLFLPLMFLGIFTNLTAEDKPITFDTPKTYEGVATPLANKMGINATFDQEYKGYIEYVPMAGTLFKGPVLDRNGKVLEQGDVLVKISTQFRDAQVLQAKAAVNKDIATLNSMKMQYERYEKINRAGQGAISAQEFVEAKNSYLEALSQLEADRAALILAQKLREACTYYAQFDGVVEEVMKPAGWGGDFGVPTITVSQLVPIGIDVKMTKDEAIALNTDTTILIYPLTDHSRPIEPFRGAGRLIDTGVQLIVRNCLLAPDHKEIDGKMLKVVHELSAVAPFRLNKEFEKGDPLSINELCIMKDDKGTYVLKDDCQKPDTMGQGIHPIIHLKKVYITVGNKVNPIESDVNYIALDESKGLEFNDKLVFAKDAKGLKDGDTVYYQRQRYMFMPGDPVKVVIGGKPVPRPPSK